MTDRMAQAWIALAAEDPEATSALGVARASLTSGAGLQALERFRVIEIAGSAADAAEIARRLHASTQFYNPHKERVVLRTRAVDATPAAAATRLLLVFETGGERRPPAERWWRHETGEAVEVREGVVWAVTFAPGVDADAAALDLGRLRDARHGMFCNPWFQRLKIGAPPPPLGWIDRGVFPVEAR